MRCSIAALVGAALLTALVAGTRGHDGVREAPDDEPGGEWVADTDFWIAGPHPSFFVDPCEYAVELIG